MLGLVIFYAIVFVCFSNASPSTIRVLHFMHALLWRIYHTFVLGWILKAQSDSKFLVRHFLKHYHYSSSNLESGRGAVQEAFSNFKGLYNLAMCMTYSAFVAYHIMGSTKKNLKSHSTRQKYQTKS